MKKQRAPQHVSETGAVRDTLSKCFEDSPVSKVTALVFAGLLVSVLTLSSVSAVFNGTGIPEDDSVVGSDQPCFASGCHASTGGTFNTNGAVTLTGLPDQFTPGETYDLQLSVEGGPGEAIGVQVAAVHDDNSQAGTLSAVTQGLATVTYSGVTALTHQSPLNSRLVDFQWTAPAQAAGPVTFRFAMNSANGNGSNTGDSIYFDTLTVQPEQQVEMEVVDRLYVPLFGNGTSGNIRFQTTLSLANTTGDALLGIEFRGRGGEELMVDLGELGIDSLFQVPVSSGQGLTIQTSGEGTLQLGYVIVHVAREAGTDDRAGVGGTAIFTRSQADSGVILYEAGVPLTPTETDMTVILDSIGVRDTGLALVNVPAEGEVPGAPATVTITVWDSDFQSMIAPPTQVMMQDGEALGQFIWEIFSDGGASQETLDQLQETEAIVTISSDEELAAVTMRQNDDGAIDFPMEVPTLTTFPVIPGRADANQ